MEYNYERVPGPYLVKENLQDLGTAIQQVLQPLRALRTRFFTY